MKEREKKLHEFKEIETKATGMKTMCNVIWIAYKMQEKTKVRTKQK